MSRSIPTLALLIALALTASTTSAQGKLESSFVRSDGSLRSASAATAVTTPGAPILFGAGGSTTITQNASQDIVPLTGIACPTPPNSWYRVFDLSTFGLADGIDVTSVDIGIQEIGPSGATAVNLYRLSGAFTQANLALVGTAPLVVSSADNLSLVNVPITGSFESGDMLVVEWAVPFAGAYFGGNAAGQTGPTYIRAAGCGAAEPADLATLGFGFPDAHWVVNVTGTTAPIVGPSLHVPGTVAFGDVAVGETSETETVSITNNGTEAVTITSITASGDAAFTVTMTGTDLTLDPGQSTTLTVTFAPTAHGDVTGTITIVSNAPNSPQTINLSGTGFSPPPNDNFADAIEITETGTYTGTNVAATVEGGEEQPVCSVAAAGTGGVSVWWVYTPAGDGLLSVDLAASDYDTSLAFYQEDGTLIACNEDGNPDFTSVLTDVLVTGGRAVYIRVGGYRDANQGNISFDLSFMANGLVTSAIPAGDTTGEPTWNRPFTDGIGTSGSCSLSSSATAVSYEARSFIVATDSVYTITTDYTGTPDFDGFLFLYRGAFNAADPCLNLVALDDDFEGQGGSQFANFDLMTGQYTLVVTGHSNDDFGTYTGDVVGPAAVRFISNPLAGEGTPGMGQTMLTASPNPVSSSARVRLAVETAQDVTVAVYDMTGRQIATLFQGAVAAGQALDLGLDASALPAGVYAVRATGDAVNLTQRVTVVR
ncbi:MAG TPA: choice-of-anchor D domain-containing protein [Rubricoccaceae bacterium]|jgi:hypothetical protein